MSSELTGTICYMLFSGIYWQTRLTVFSSEICFTNSRKLYLLLIKMLYNARRAKIQIRRYQQEPVNGA